MTLQDELARKSNKKNKPSSAYKSQLLKKSLSNKQKIINQAKKSTLKDIYQIKPRISLKGRSSTTQKKKQTNAKETESQKNKINKTIGLISKSVPLKHGKQKTQQLAFEAIKFKDKASQQNNQNKTHDEFYIQYDEPQITDIDMTVLNNSKKIIGTSNQRIGRYNENKIRSKLDFGSETKSNDFKEAVAKLFKFLDPHCTRVISHPQIDYKKVPQAVLYFLGGLFQRMREKNMYMSQKEFLQECNSLYARSSKEDIKWFMQQIELLPQSLGQKAQNPQSTQKNIGKFQINPHQKNNQPNPKEDQLKEKNLNVETNIQRKKYNNLSFDQQDFSMSFRNHQNDRSQDYKSKASNPSERQSFQSAKFGSHGQNILPYVSFEKAASQIDRQNQKRGLNQMLQIQKPKDNEFQFFENLNASKLQHSKVGGIRKNITDKAEDFREQIYAKLDKMKLGLENKQNHLLRDNFKMSSTVQTISNSNKRDIFNSGKRENLSIGADLQFKKFISPSNVIQENTKQRTPFSEKQQNYQINVRDHFLNENHQIKQSRTHQQQKQSGWVNKIKNCQKAFDQLQKIKDQFKTQKSAIQNQQRQRFNYLKDGQKKLESLNRSKDFVLEQQTRIVKLGYFKPQKQKHNLDLSMGYQKNIDRMSNLNISRNQNLHSINLNDSLSNSYRKSIDVTLPLRSDAYRGSSLSEKKGITFDKMDKIDELSKKLEVYLKTNAQKIQYSKNFTQSVAENSLRLSAI